MDEILEAHQAMDNPVGPVDLAGFPQWEKGWKRLSAGHRRRRKDAAVYCLLRERPPCGTRGESMVALHRESNRVHLVNERTAWDGGLRAWFEGCKRSRNVRELDALLQGP